MYIIAACVFLTVGIVVGIFYHNMTLPAPVLAVFKVFRRWYRYRRHIKTVSRPLYNEGVRVRFLTANELERYGFAFRHNNRWYYDNSRDSWIGPGYLSHLGCVFDIADTNMNGTCVSMNPVNNQRYPNGIDEAQSVGSTYRNSRLVAPYTETATPAELVDWIRKERDGNYPS